MESVLSLFLHLDQHLQTILLTYGAWTYLILFLVIFCETGLVFTPFLPGDSLLFVAGAFTASGFFKLIPLFVLLFIAAILGDSVNYIMGSKYGIRIFQWKIPFLKKEHLHRTQQFYDKYGATTIILARFIPIIRTFAPFVAGIGSMKYSRFMFYNVFGGFVWVAGFLFLGFFFGNIPVVKKNLSVVIIGIIILSILPAFFEVAKKYFYQKKSLPTL